MEMDAAAKITAATTAAASIEDGGPYGPPKKYLKL